MATGRTLKRWSRIFVNGMDLSGYTREVGPLAWTYDEVEQTALLDGVKGALPNHPEISIGTLNGLFDNMATVGIHTALGTAGGDSRNVLIAMGIQAAPAKGDPAFMGAFNQVAYQIAPSGGDVALTVPFGKISPAKGLLYEQPWGRLLHENAAETGANTAAGIDDFGAATAKGGYLMCHILSVTGTGTVTINVQDAATNSNAQFADITGATTGAIAHGSVPYSCIVQLGKTADVRRYLRWQMTLSTITACTFVLGFVRGR